MRSRSDLGHGRSMRSLRDLRRRCSGGRVGLGVAGLVGWLVAQSPKVAAACAVCTAGRDEENAAAFLITTIFMSITPLIAIGTLVFVIWRRMRKLEQQNELRRHGLAGSTQPPVSGSEPASQPIS